MVETVYYPATEGMTQKLRLRGTYVELKGLSSEEGRQLGHSGLSMYMDEEQNFAYQTWSQQYSVPDFVCRVHGGKLICYRLRTFLLEGSRGSNLTDYDKEQVITDILSQYERYFNFTRLHREVPGHSVVFPDA